MRVIDTVTGQLYDVSKADGKVTLHDTEKGKLLRAMTEARFNEALKTQELETMPV
jgi:hypothetical protein